MKLYNTDYVLYWIDNGMFDFELNNYPYIYGGEDHVEEDLLCSYDEDEYETYLDVDMTYIPTTQLPKDKQQLLIKMIKEVK